MMANNKVCANTVCTDVLANGCCFLFRNRNVMSFKPLTDFL